MRHAKIWTPRQYRLAYGRREVMEDDVMDDIRFPPDRPFPQPVPPPPLRRTKDRP